MVDSVGGPGTVQQMSIEGLDLESMLMAVQTNRVNLMDQQLKDQMGAVQNRNNRINELNVGMNGMNAVLPKLGADATAELKGQNKIDFVAAAPKVVSEEAQAIRDGDAKMAGATGDKKTVLAVLESYLDDVDANEDPATEYSKRKFVMDQMVAAGYDVPNALSGMSGGFDKALFKPEVGKFLEWLKDPNIPVKMKFDPKATACDNRAKAEAYIKTLQSEIDALGNSQQMDMLRLQSLSNKRNEAFEIMTNFMKKLADSRSGIIQKF